MRPQGRFRSFEDYALTIIEELPSSADKPETERVRRPLDDLQERQVLLDEFGDFVRNEPRPYDREIDEEARAIIDEGVGHYGIEFLAFYKSPHYLRERPYPGLWGIFLLDWGVAYLQELIVDHYSGAFSHPDGHHLATRFLRTHEAFHFRVDAWALSVEAASEQHVYRPYHEHVYRRYFPGTELVEESLANGAILAPRSLPEIRDFARHFMRSQPGAYSKPVQPGIEQRALLAAQLIQNEKWQPGQTLPYLGHWVGFGRDTLLSESNCPVYTVVGTQPWLFVTPAFAPPGLREFKAFVTRYLAGELARETDHELYRIDNGELIKMPNPHSGLDRLKPGEFKNSLMKAGMRASDYWRERSRTRRWKASVPRGVIAPPIR